MTDGSSNVAFQIRILQHVTCGVAVQSKCIVQRSLLFECHSGTQDTVSFKNPLYLESVSSKKNRKMKPDKPVPCLVSIGTTPTKGNSTKGMFTLVFVHVSFLISFVCVIVRCHDFD